MMNPTSDLLETPPSKTTITTMINQSSSFDDVVQDECDIYLDHCHHDYCYDEVVGLDEDAGEDAIAMYNQFFEQQSKLVSRIEENANKKRTQQLLDSSSDVCESSPADNSALTTTATCTNTSSLSIVSEEENQGEEESGHAHHTPAGVFSIQCTLLEDQEEDQEVASIGVTKSLSPKSPSRKKHKEYSKRNSKDGNGNKQLKA